MDYDDKHRSQVPVLDQLSYVELNKQQILLEEAMAPKVLLVSSF